MKKADLIEEIHNALGSTHKESEQIVEIILDSMVRALRAGDKVEIRGFGTFHSRARKAWTAHNPRTGAYVEVPAKRVPRFRASRELLTILNSR